MGQGYWQLLLGSGVEIFCNFEKSKKDATGNFLAYLIPKVCVHAFQTSGRYDVGNLASYKECLNGMTEKNWRKGKILNVQLMWLKKDRVVITIL